MQVGKLQKWQSTFYRSVHQFALVRINGIPLVDGQHHSTATVQNKASNVGVLLCDALSGIQQQQNDIGRFNGLQGFNHREFFNGFKNFALAAQTRRVDEFELLSVPLKGNRDGVAGGTRHVKGNQALFTQPSIDEG